MKSGDLRRIHPPRHVMTVRTFVARETCQWLGLPSFRFTLDCGHVEMRVASMLPKNWKGPFVLCGQCLTPRPMPR